MDIRTWCRPTPSGAILTPNKLDSRSINLTPRKCFLRTYISKQTLMLEHFHLEQILNPKSVNRRWALIGFQTTPIPGLQILTKIHILLFDLLTQNNCTMQIRTIKISGPIQTSHFTCAKYNSYFGGLKLLNTPFHSNIKISWFQM